MKIFRLFPVLVSFFVLSTITYYYIQLVEKEYYANYLQAVDTIFAKGYKKAKTNMEKNRLSDDFAPILTTLIERIDSLRGSWKQMHVVYHTMARASLALGRVGDSGRFLKRSLHYHPYYANAYEMLGNVWMILGRRDKEKACKAAAKAIFKGHKPEQSFIRLCNS